MTELRCDWCGNPVAADDGYRLEEPAAGRAAAFCRLEHVVPWSIQGRGWTVGEASLDETCVECGRAAVLLLVRHRGEHRIRDAFCSIEHAADWAKAGGRWR
jgi:hypothetical protein